jgi:hypothetical protein
MSWPRSEAPQIDVYSRGFRLRQQFFDPVQKSLAVFRKRVRPGHQNQERWIDSIDITGNYRVSKSIQVPPVPGGRFE